MINKFLIGLISSLVFLFLYSCEQGSEKKYMLASGPIQGTTYNVTYYWHKDVAPEIDSVLHLFNKSLSNFDKNSVISRINRNETDEADELFIEMFDAAYKVYNETNGAFDITVAPIANFWGFGWENADKKKLDKDIDSILNFVGMDLVRLENNKVIKSNPNTGFIGSAIAKGQSVDYLGRFLESLGIDNYLIEIGGEILTKGLSPRKEKWRIGIDKPIEGSAYHDRENHSVVELTDKALATSGNYRNFIVKDGKLKGHSLDPRTGYPAENNLLSVTVITDLCIFADAYATAFMVLGKEKSLEITNSMEDVQALFIYLDKDENISTVLCDGFGKYLKEEQ